MIRPEYIRAQTENISIPDGCHGCAHLSNGTCLIGFGQRSHDFEDLNFFNVATGYHGMRNGKNACYHTHCGPTNENGTGCQLVFEYLQKPGMTAQLNPDILRDTTPTPILDGAFLGKTIRVYQGDASWWVGDALVCSHGFTIGKVAGLSGIENNHFSGELSRRATGPWTANVRYLVRNVGDLIANVRGSDSIGSVCFTAHRHATESVRRQIPKLINAFPDLTEIALCDYRPSTWADWNMAGMLGIQPDR